MSDVLVVAVWWIEVQVLGLIIWPLAFRWLRWLPDRGYMLAKPLGLLLVTYSSWLLASLRIIPNTPLSFILSIIGVALISFTTYRRHSSRDIRLRDWLHEHRRWIAAYEIVLALALIGWALFRAYLPDAASSEKPMDLAFLGAIQRSAYFPPYDPWFAGGTIPYYYFGYVMMAALNQLPQLSAGTVHSLTGATWFALSAAGAFGLTANLVLLSNRRAKSAALFYGALAAVMLMLMSNLEPPLEIARAARIGSQDFWTWLDIPGLKKPLPPGDQLIWPPRDQWWWQASRVIHDYAPTSLDAQRATLLGRTPDTRPVSQEFIDEFPQFIFLLGDDHAHVLDLPFVLLAVGLALNVYQATLSDCFETRSSTASSKMPGAFSGTRSNQTASSRFESVLLSGAMASSGLSVQRAAQWFMIALALGALLCINSWDYPIYLMLTIAAVALARWQQRQFKFIAVAVDAAILIILSWLLYLPYHLSSASPGLLPWPNLFNGTRLSQFFVVFGIFIVIGSVFILKLLMEHGRTRQLRYGTFGLKAISGGMLLLIFVATMVALMGSVVYQSSADVRAWFDALVAQMSARSITPGDHIVLRLLDPWVSLSIAITLAAIVLIWRARRASFPMIESHDLDPTSFVTLLFVIGLVLALAVESVYAVGVLDKTRLNTGFKLYFQIWVLWSIASAYALFYVLHGPRRVVTRWKRFGITVVSAIMIGLGLIYPVLAIPDRIDPTIAPTLDVMLAATRSATSDEATFDAYQAAQWLNAHAAGTPVILEASDDDPSFPVGLSRLSSWTGLPTVLGWYAHEAQWRGDEASARQRLDDVTQIYSTQDVDAARARIDHYGITYVFIGSYERRLYPPEGLAKFDAMYPVVFRSGDTVIYQAH